MPIPIIYNVRSVRARWTSSIVAVLGIAGTVGVLLAMLAMADGFRHTLVLVALGGADVLPETIPRLAGQAVTEQWPCPATSCPRGCLPGRRSSAPPPPLANTASPRGPRTRTRSKVPTRRVSGHATNRPPRLTSTLRPKKLLPMSTSCSRTWIELRRDARRSCGTGGVGSLGDTRATPPARRLRLWSCGRPRIGQPGSP